MLDLAAPFLGAALSPVAVCCIELFAVINASSRQNIVRVGDSFIVNRIAAEPDSEFVVDDVLLIADEKGVKIGAPDLSGANVICKVVAHTRGPKIRVQRYKAKKHYERRAGHRQNQTVLKVTGIRLGRTRRTAYPETQD